METHIYDVEFGFVERFIVNRGMLNLLNLLHLREVIDCFYNCCSL